jgi:hypothetical protein
VRVIDYLICFQVHYKVLMGTTCSKCNAVETSEATLTAVRPDAPDPAMYTLMRRSVELSDPYATMTAANSGGGGGGNHSSNTGSNNNSNNNNASLVAGQAHLLYKQQTKLVVPIPRKDSGQPVPFCPTRIIVRRHSLRSYEEGFSGTHIYAIRYPADQPLELTGHWSATSGVGQEQAPRKHYHSSSSSTRNNKHHTNNNVESQSAAAAAAARTVTLLEPPKAFVEIKGKEENVDRLFHPATLSIPPKHTGMLQLLLSAMVWMHSIL